MGSGIERKKDFDTGEEEEKRIRGGERGEGIEGGAEGGGGGGKG